MPKLVMKIYNVSVALFIVGLLVFMYSEERFLKDTSRSNPEAIETAVPADSLREEVEEYVTKTMERYDLSERGINMEMLDTTEGLRIRVCGEVENEESLRVLQLFFDRPYTNPDLPVPLVWDVGIKQI